MKTLTKNRRDHGGQAHEHTHGNKIKIFRRIWPSFSIRRERMYVSTRLRWHVFVCLSTMISSIFGKSFHFSFPYFVLFVLRYFPFHVVSYLFLYFLNIRTFKNYRVDVYEKLCLLLHPPSSLRLQLMKATVC